MSEPTLVQRLADSRTRRAPRAGALGVTLTELMIVLVIIAIVVAAALPTILGNLANRRAYEGASAINRVFKAQRYRAQNLNRAVGVKVSSTDNKVYTYVSGDNTCSGVGSGTETTAVDLANHEDAALIDGDFTDVVVCIKPDGSVVDPSDGQPFDNEPVQFTVKRADLVSDAGARAHTITVPFNGIARLD